MGQLLSGLMIGGRVVPEMLLSSKKIKLVECQDKRMAPY